VAGTLAVSGIVESDSAGTLPVTVRLGDVEFLRSTGSPFEGGYDLTGLAPGAYTLTVHARLHEVERGARELEPEAGRLWRHPHAKPVAEALHTWLSEQRQKLAKADVTAKAIDYSLSNWPGLTCCLDDGHLPIGNNAAENAVRPLAGRKNWLSVGSQQDGERAATVLSLMESAKLDGHDPGAYLSLAASSTVHKAPRSAAAASKNEDFSWSCTWWTSGAPPEAEGRRLHETLRTQARTQSAAQMPSGSSSFMTFPWSCG
jgi:hypothetical protein